MDIKFDWNLIIQSLLVLYQTPNHLLLKSQLSYTDFDNPHKTCFLNNSSITSLYHEFFPAVDADEFTQLSKMPAEYNMGRNMQTEIAFSKTNKYLIKTVSTANFIYFKKQFHVHYQQLSRDNPLIAKTYGVYRLEGESSNIHFILMENLFYYQQGKILNIYDLKGAVVNRSNKNFMEEYSIQKSKLALNQIDDLQIVKGKDEDFRKINFFADVAHHYPVLIEELKLESQILSQAKIMDYSLMIIVGYFEKFAEHPRLIRLSEHIGVTFGIIDYFQEFNQIKKLESKVKNFLNHFKQQQISCVDADTYQQRFMQYFTSLHHQK